MSLIFSNKEAAIANQMFNPREPRDTDNRDDATAPAGPASEITPVPSPQREAGRRPFFWAHHHVDRQFIAEEAARIVVPEEVLVVDSRHAFTPSQMVDQQLQALLGICPGSFRPGHQPAAYPAKGRGIIRRSLRLFRGA
jgi:hypothetical protein